MAGKEKADSESIWELGSHDVNLFGSDYRASVLSEFDWNIPVDSNGVCGCDGGFVDLDRIEADLADSSAPYWSKDMISRSRVEQMVVEEKVEASVSASPSSSSEDPPEKSTSSGAVAANLPWEAASKRKMQKRIQQPRFAFVTKSEVDHLEDGYRWRKYGQKAVKNSPFPRSYYRCTNNKCMVKKRIERSSSDPSTVITTYEGQHCHHSVGYTTTQQNHPFSNYFTPSNLFHHHHILPNPQQLPPHDQGKAGGESHTRQDPSLQPTG